MTFPDRTYETITLPGSSRTTRYLSTPVDGGSGGSATPDTEQYIVGFVATENTGVATVLVEPEEQVLTQEEILQLLSPSMSYYDGNHDPAAEPTFVAGDGPTVVFFFDMESVPGVTGGTLQVITDEVGMTNLDTWEYSDEEGYEGDYDYATSTSIFGSGNPDLNTEDVIPVAATTNGCALYAFETEVAPGEYDIVIEWNFDQLTEPVRQTVTVTFTAE